MSTQTKQWMTIPEYCESFYTSTSIVSEGIAQGTLVENEHWRRENNGEIFINYEAMLWLAINNLS